jgi:hypothetical protein
MPKRLVVSPELLLLAPLPSHRQAVGRALRDLVARHGEMPVVTSANTAGGEVFVADGPKILDRLVFQVEDWHIPEPQARNWRLA